MGAQDRESCWSQFQDVAIRSSTSSLVLFSRKIMRAILVWNGIYTAEHSMTRLPGFRYPGNASRKRPDGGRICMARIFSRSEAVRDGLLGTPLIQALSSFPMTTLMP